MQSIWNVLGDLKRACMCGPGGFGIQRNRPGYDILRRAETYLEYGSLVHPGCTTESFDPHPPKRDRWGDPL